MASTYPLNTPPSLRKLRKPDKTRLAVRRDPNKLPAAILAIIVHIAFFALIIFGVTWQVKHPTPITAEIWDSLPPVRNTVAAPVSVQSPPPESEPVVKKPEPVAEKLPPVPTRAEIELKTKREREELIKQKKLERAETEKAAAQKKLEDVKKTEEDKKRRELETAKAQKAANAKLLTEQIARENQLRETQAAARSAAVNDYSAKIAALIRSRANIPDTVVGKPKISVRLRLLVNGVVFDAQVVTPSGNRVYDESVERAINGIKNWPEPDKPELVGANRTLILNIEHER